MKKLLFYIVFITALFYSGIQLYFGTSSIMTTLLFYVLLYVTGAVLIGLFGKWLSEETKANSKMLIASLLVSLFVGEVFLRYVFKKNLVYSERTGQYYHSSYSDIVTWQGIKEYIFKTRNFWYLHGAPNTTRPFVLEGHTILHSYNALGLRDKELPPAADDSTNLIIGIGDSFTEGIGTAQDSTWLKFLERDINACRAQKIKTLNAGAQGSDVFFEYLLLEKLLKNYHPHTVVLCINSTDIDDIIFKGGRNRFKPDGRIEYNNPPYWEKLYAVSYIFRAIKHTTSNLHWTLLTQAEHETKARQSIDSIQLCIERFQQLAKQKGFKLAVAFHPTIFEIKSGKFPFAGLAAKLSADTSYAIINVYDEFSKSGIINKTNADDFYWQTDLHHNARGYKAMGDAIAQRLKYCD